MPLRCLEEIEAVLFVHRFVVIHEGLDIALDHGERGAELVGDVGDEFLANAFEGFLARYVVQNEQRPLPITAVERQGGCPRDLHPARFVRFDKLHFKTGLRPPCSHAFHVVQKLHAV